MSLFLCVHTCMWCGRGWELPSHETVKFYFSYCHAMGYMTWLLSCCLKWSWCNKKCSSRRPTTIVDNFWVNITNICLSYLLYWSNQPILHWCNSSCFPSSWRSFRYDVTILLLLVRIQLIEAFDLYLNFKTLMKGGGFSLYKNCIGNTHESVSTFPASSYCTEPYGVTKEYSENLWSFVYIALFRTYSILWSWKTIYPSRILKQTQQYLNCMTTVTAVVFVTTNNLVVIQYV